MSKKNISIFMVLLLVLAAGWVYLNPALFAPREKVKLTLQELKEFDGKEGRPTYVAVAGKIYDLSRCRHWNNGEHPKADIQTLAGRDLTGLLNNSNHGLKYLNRYPVVGQLVERQE